MFPSILILAAGQGKRMRSATPKILHPVLFKPMIHYVLDLAKSIPHSSLSVVIGHGNDQVREACTGYEGVQFFIQEKQKGTADAVRAAEPFLAKQTGDVLILSGDVILLTKESISCLLDKHQTTHSLGTLLTAVLETPTGYGRIQTKEDKVLKITEERDCTVDQRKIREVNAGIYCFDIKSLFSTLPLIENRNDQTEYYLTDVIEILAKKPGSVSSLTLKDPTEMLGINDRADLARVQKQMQRKINKHWMEQGVTIYDPESTYIDPSSVLEQDSTLESGVFVVRSKIGKRVDVEANCRIFDSEIADDSFIKQGCYIENSKIDSHCKVGPYAHLRPGTHLSNGVKVGNFVELKKSEVGENSKIPHLSYVGDALIGSNVNIGCGFVTCNYDGKQKHQTIIEDNVFIGSDSQTVAPVKVGKGSYVASGSTITEDVPADSLVITRGKQTTKLGYGKKYTKN